MKWLAIVPLAFIGVFYFYPIITIMSAGLAPDGILSLRAFETIFASDYYRKVLAFTAGQAALSTVITIVLALPSAYIFVRYRFRGKTLLLALATLPFVLPTVVVAAAFSSLIGARGVVNALLISIFRLSEPPIQLERTLTIILIAHVFYNYAVALRILISSWASQSPRLEEAARMMGASGWRLWWFVRLPLLRPALIAASSLVFTFTFTSFGVILILGGSRFATLEVEIYQQVTGLLNLPIASALSLIQIMFMFILLVFYTGSQRRVAVDQQAAATIARPPRTWRGKLSIVGVLLLIGGLLIAPMLALIVRSFTAGTDGFTFDHYARLSINPRDSVLYAPPLEAMANSLVFAAITTVLAVIMGSIMAYLLYRARSTVVRLLDPLLMLPLATSAVTLGFGFLIALDEPPINLRSSLLLIPIAHTLVAMPFVVRSILPALRSINPSIEDAARSLGASGWRLWWQIQLPLIARGLFVGAAFAFTVSMGEFGASAFIARPDTPTAPIVIFRLLGQPGATNYGGALAMSAILMMVCAIAFIGIERFRSAGIGEF
ncbi:MAG: iron ABC transporter permease [Chloroflexota bacterium]|nr:iron ABC transporter permease [Chloroflexota bacterium]